MGDELAFGHEERYYAERGTVGGGAQRSRRESPQEAMIRRLLDDDVPERVRKAYKQWNLIIRDQMRSETGLRLSIGDERQAVPIRVVPGLPLPFADLFGKYEDEFLWKLVLERPLLEATAKGLELLIRDFNSVSEILHHSLTGPDGDIHLRRSHEILKELIAAIEVKRLIEDIKNIHEDILGAYFFHQRAIQLYWMVIGVMARILGVSVEDLTLVVMIHEVAHAYTHLGRDIDGRQWDTNDFARTEIPIVEGLAQFYTGVISEKLETRKLGVKSAYEELLDIQSGPYQVHQDWFERDEDPGEIVRFSMIECRTNGITFYNDFIERLSSIKTQIGQAQ